MNLQHKISSHTIQIQNLKEEIKKITLENESKEKSLFLVSQSLREITERILQFKNGKGSLNKTEDGSRSTTLQRDSFDSSFNFRTISLPLSEDSNPCIDCNSSLNILTSKSISPSNLSYKNLPPLPLPTGSLAPILSPKPTSPLPLPSPTTTHISLPKLPSPPVNNTSTSLLSTTPPSSPKTFEDSSNTDQSSLAKLKSVKREIEKETQDIERKENQKKELLLELDTLNAKTVQSIKFLSMLKSRVFLLLGVSYLEALHHQLPTPFEYFQDHLSGNNPLDSNIGDINSPKEHIKENTITYKLTTTETLYEREDIEDLFQAFLKSNDISCWLQYIEFISNSLVHRPP